MKILLALALLFGVTAMPQQAAALSTADFTVSPEPTPATPYRELHVGTTYTFDSTNLVVCDTAPPQGSGCSYTWYGTYPTRGGGTNYLVQLGNGIKATWTASDHAATKPYITIILKVTSSNSTHRYVLAFKRFKVVA